MSFEKQNYNHIHTPEDGRGRRDVFLNGKLLQGVFYADTRRGIVRAFILPLRLDRWKKRVLSRTFHGQVTVQAKTASQPAQAGIFSSVGYHLSGSFYAIRTRSYKRKHFRLISIRPARYPAQHGQKAFT